MAIADQPVHEGWAGVAEDETRLKQLAQMVTGKEVEKLRRLEAGIVCGGSCLDMLSRRADTTREVVGPPGSE
jgi:hypothetical protein